MSFLSPAAFLFAAAIPVVIVFYLLKRKRVVKLVSSTLLWQKFMAETQANAPFQKLRHNWLLVLQLLLLALIILALARPFFTGNTQSSTLRVMILDASASMQSTDESPSRFEKARAEALKWVDGLRDNDEMLVLLAGGNTEVRQSATRNKPALRRAIETSQVADSPTRLTEALKLADVLTRDRDKKDNAEVHLFSDGAVAELESLQNKGMRLIYHKVGQRGNNAGITTLDVRSNPDNPRQRALYTSVANYSSNALPADIELSFGGQVIDTHPVTLAPGETSPQVFVANQPSNGVFTVRLKVQDDLAVDNTASIPSILPEPIRVLLVSRGNRFLEKALRASPQVDLGLAKDLSGDSGEFDIVVLDDVTPQTWPKGSVLAIHVAATNWFESMSRIENPAVVDWKNTHPLLRYVNFDNIQIAETLSIKSPSWAVSLVDAQQTPLIVAGELDRQRIVWVGFDTLQSTWPLRVAFPIFIGNAVEWLNPASEKAGQRMVRAGEPLRLALPQGGSAVTVVLPDGQEKAVSIVPGAREAVFGDTLRQGVYRLRNGTNEAVFAVNLLDAAESNTKPRDELQVGKFGQVEATTLKRANLELWRWIAAMGLCVLMFEWWYYHRRTA